MFLHMRHKISGMQADLKNDFGKSGKNSASGRVPGEAVSPG